MASGGGTRACADSRNDGLRRVSGASGMRAATASRRSDRAFWDARLVIDARRAVDMVEFGLVAQRHGSVASGNTQPGS
jgi:hypothetical protein